MASSVNALTSSSAATPGATSSNLMATPDKELFLKLLVAQIKNQDPLNPADSMQFVSQLAQFSELEQVIAIRAAVEAQAGSAPTTETAATSGN